MFDRQLKIAALRRAIAQGTYHVPAALIAARIMNRPPAPAVGAEQAPSGARRRSTRLSPFVIASA